MIGFAVCLWGFSAIRRLPPIAVERGKVAEVSFRSNKHYENPFQEITVDAVVTEPSGTELRIPAFWAGGDTWKFRFSSRELGKHPFKTECSDSTNSLLQSTSGEVDVVPYRGTNPLLVHGQIQIAPDKRHFQSSDGTPFFWLADTWWKGLCKRISFNGFKDLTKDRKSKGFTVVQIVAGPYPDETPFDPRWENEGGFPYDRNYTRVNPFYFDAADRRIQALVDAGITPAIVGGWGWHMPTVGAEKFSRHWRYLVARYAAYPVIWIVAGEGGGASWTQVAKSVRSIDPYHHLMTIHPYRASRKSVTDESVLDFEMLQTGHDDWNAASNTVANLTASYSKTPIMPVLVGEVAYEGHMMRNREDLQRFIFWTSVLNGAAGHTYGAGGIWQINSDKVRGAEYEYTPWSVAMNLPGSAEIGRAKQLLMDYPWWRFEPHPDWVEPHSTVLLEPHDQFYDAKQLWTSQGGVLDAPYAAGVPGEARVIYIPAVKIYNWTPPTVTHLENDVNYHAFFYEPMSGQRLELGTLVHPVEKGNKFSDDFSHDDTGNWTDAGTKTLREGGHLIGEKNMATVTTHYSPKNVRVSVRANSNSESGIILRFHDFNNYTVALYSPLFHSIYFHERKNGNWGEVFGKTDVPTLGDKIKLTAAVYDDSAAFTITDGTRTYTTPSIKLTNNTAGPIGLWHYQIGDSQQFDEFMASEIGLPAFQAKPKERELILNENPHVLPKVEIPEISLMLSDTYRPARLPVPQDWVLVLERVH